MQTFGVSFSVPRCRLAPHPEHNRAAEAAFVYVSDAWRLLSQELLKLLKVTKIILITLGICSL